MIKTFEHYNDKKYAIIVKNDSGLFVNVKIERTSSIGDYNFKEINGIIDFNSINTYTLKEAQYLIINHLESEYVLSDFDTITIDELLLQYNIKKYNL